MKNVFTILAVLAIASSANAGLIAYYNFGTSTPTSANQGTAGTAADGVLMNGATIVDIDPSDSGVEWALQLTNDATTGGGLVNNQYMNITNGDDAWYDDAFPTAGARTYAAWVRMDTDTTQGWSMIMSKGYDAALNLGAGTPQGDSMDQIVFSYHSAFASWSPLKGTVSAMSDTYWIHVIATVDDGADSKTASLYINGELQESRQTYGRMYQNDLDLLIGAEPNRTAFDYGWNGMLDDIHIYDEHIDAQGAMSLFVNTYSDTRPIAPEPAPIALLCLNGGETLTAGSTYPINWSSTGNISDVLIEYSIDNGQAWNEINTVPNTGSYDWLVPVVNSNQCLVCVSDASNPSFYDISNAVFTIYDSGQAELIEFSDEITFKNETGEPQYFVDFESYIDGTPVVGQPTISGNEWSSLGIQFAPLESGSTMVLFDHLTSDEYVSPTHTIGPTGDRSSYIITFSTPVVSFGMYIVGNEITSINEKIILKDNNGNILGEYPMSVNPSITFSREISKEFRGYASDIPIGEVHIIEDADGEGMSMDNVMYSVSEPAGPVADAGEDQEVGVGAVCTADVLLDGSGSNDADGDELTYTWFLDGEEIATGVKPTIELTYGIYTIELIVNDGMADSEPDYVVITVVNIEPTANAGGPYIEPATSWDGAKVQLDGTGSSDPDGDEIIYEWDLDRAVDSDEPPDGDPNNDVDATGASPAGDFPIGQTEISLVVIDECGARSEADVMTVTVSFIKVGVEIRSDDGTDTINLESSGVVRVTFLTDSDFDATTVDPLTVTLRGMDFDTGLVKLRGKNESVPMVVDQDFDGDGDVDRVVNLDTERLAEYEMDAYCEVGALTYDGLVVLGDDLAHLAPVSEGSE